MHTLTRLQQWYESYCDVDWEHGFGIRITTLDNPGWSMTINLEGTDLENQPFSSIEDIEPERDWICCWVTENTFHGVGGPQKLESMIELFLNWADTQKNSE